MAEWRIGGVAEMRGKIYMINETHNDKKEVLFHVVVAREARVHE